MGNREHPDENRWQNIFSQARKLRQQPDVVVKHIPYIIDAVF
jgi:hypothetical protein